MTTAVIDEISTAPAAGASAAADDVLPVHSRWVRRVIIILGVTTGVLAATGAALAFDRATADQLLPGVTIGGVDAGGRSLSSIRREFAATTAEVGQRTVHVTAAGQRIPVSLASLGVKSTVDEALAAAQEDRREMTLPIRMWNTILRRDIDRSYAVRYEVDPAKAGEAVKQVAAKVDAPPVDAQLDTSSGFVKVVPATPGRTLDQPAATGALLGHAREAANRDRTDPALAPPLELKPNDVAAAVTGFTKVILVRLGENKLYLYENGEIVKTYNVATGSPKYPTPKGTFKVIERRRNPTWINPDPTGWGKSMPRRIGPGPSNPLGTRALRLNSPGINIHGTSNIASLGQSVSHGCIRMAISQSEELFELIPMNTPVIILQAKAAHPAPAAASTDPIDDQNIPIDLAGQG